MVVQSHKVAAWRRIVGAAIVAVVVGGVWMQVLIPNPCKGLTPSDFNYWMYSCWSMDPAAAAPRTAFLVR